ncbi:hypothetical protein FH972_023020 [Carpinus fangiana]|uniref:Ubiquitin-like modifier-activating enzyme ATG7 n=1 Tax=Carpinus fangiana TaxID=176857 RepID=A0A5N6KUK4_9ROSI|nr:hypothetical protein FH972_023020 [Carpinus fangiana]
MATLQFAPWSSDIELSFYAALASLKINHDKLDDAARKIVGRYEIRQNDAPERSARMQVHGTAFTTDALPQTQFRAEGILRNMNTIEEYKNLDRAAVAEQAGRTVWEAILDGSIYSCPSLLSSFYAIFFADLKKYKFTYHFVFPALHSDPPWKLETPSSSGPAKLEPAESSLLSDAVHTWKYSVDKRQHGFFLAKRKWKGPDAEPAPEPDPRQHGPLGPESPQSPKIAMLGFEWQVASLQAYETGFFGDAEPRDRFVCFADPSTYPQNPAWMLRNLLVLVRQRWKLHKVQILSYRDTHARRDRPHSVVMHLYCPPDPIVASALPKITGWERNENNRLNSRIVDLAEYMDPAKLADQSVDLNLKLMKWRIAPDLDLDVVRNTRCLLLGAGTLGSYVSRNLMGWGVRKITFVDNGKVSFSNPVRQPLFEFKDCVGGGVDKATRAAEALKQIYPGVEAAGHVMNVPMAGHPVTNEAATKADYDKLKDLIDDHDVIFLLMDTRESRWLPSVMGKAAGKVVMNAALGFDTYVVMRHGAETSSDEQLEEGVASLSTSDSTPASPEQSERQASLGCYFCNDVVAPADSLSDRTLDQQCTVTRPGIAAIASALLVELLVSLLQSPLRARSPAPPNRSVPRSPLNHPLGLVPHSIRGYLSTWDNMLVSGPSYDCCSACSPKILSAYRGRGNGGEGEGGWHFVKQAMNEKGYVEELSGLAEVQRRAEEASKDLEWDDSEGELTSRENEYAWDEDRTHPESIGAFQLGKVQWKGGFEYSLSSAGRLNDQPNNKSAMQLSSLMLVTLQMVRFVVADGIEDLNRLQQMTASASSQIDDSVMMVNHTVAFPRNGTGQGNSTAGQTYSIAYGKDYATASTLQALVDTIGAANSNLVNGSFGEWQNGTDNGTLSAAYSAYIQEVPQLAQALTQRGRAWHNEQNQAVYLTIQSLAQVVHAFSYSLAVRKIIEQYSIISTLRAGSNLVDAQTAWIGTGSLPGRRRSIRR